jgi:hypothetical protein
MTGVTEYGEGMDVTFDYENGRPIIVARNEGGHNTTAVDLIQLLDWVRENKPDFYIACSSWVNINPRPWVGLTANEIQALIEDLRLNHEFCPKEVILKAADVIEQLLKEKHDALRPHNPPA